MDSRKAFKYKTKSLIKKIYAWQFINSTKFLMTFIILNYK